MNITFRFCFFLLSVLLFSSCVSSKKVVYFQDATPQNNDSSKNSDSSANKRRNIIIRPFDVLSVKIISSNPGFDKSFLSGASPSNPGSEASNPYFSGYLVDRDGYIHLPMLGDLQVQNLTIDEAKELIKKKALTFINDPFVEIRYLTFRVTVMGEVKKPGPINIPNERATVIDAISLSGDLNEVANSKKVKVIRGDISQDPDVYGIDLTSIKSLKSEGFNLMPNDIVYVEPLPRKFFLANASYIIMFASLFNVIVILATRFL